MTPHRPANYRMLLAPSFQASAAAADDRHPSGDLLILAFALAMVGLLGLLYAIALTGLADLGLTGGSLF
jgi:hypothetical protein